MSRVESRGVRTGAEEEPAAAPALELPRSGRRAAPRIGPSVEEPVVCTVEARGAEACAGEVRDLSALGVGLWVDAGEARALEHAVRVRLYLTFERAGDGLAFDASIRRRSTCGERVLLACELDEGGSAAQRAGRERLAHWVAERYARA